MPPRGTGSASAKKPVVKTSQSKKAVASPLKKSSKKTPADALDQPKKRSQCGRRDSDDQVDRVLQAKLDKLKRLKSDRNETDVAAALDAITKATETNTGNLLELGVAPARAKATVGEISYAIEKVVGRHQAVIT